MGYDIHRLGPGRKLVIGGIEIPFPRGLVGHSDADVLIHAIIDALLGAFMLGDIGRLFPDTDPTYRDIASTELLSRVREKIAPLGTIGYIDSTIVAEEPRMAPHLEAMREKIAATLGVPADKVSVKAKTSERLGPVGERLAIEAYAIALAER
ncbi:MAG TPA: 2-C-methyl-D-erythritol 2,4-cyclodiphosphate synthase [bacterium]|nr:2-C-methyl-D-erythritol 2,4-cyclodiphosphate synthase [bacterium]